MADFSVNHSFCYHKGKVLCYNILVPFVVLGVGLFDW